jgi:hypothetical protein
MVNNDSSSLACLMERIRASLDKATLRAKSHHVWKSGRTRDSVSSTDVSRRDYCGGTHQAN